MKILTNQKFFILASVLSLLLAAQLAHSESEEQDHPETYPVCACAMQYKPICANDGKTYSSPCDLACTQRFSPGVLALCHTECPCYPTLVDNENLVTESQFSPYLYKNAFQRSCNCPRIWKPVCGADGVTYSNECMLDCEHAKNPNIVLLYEGECA